MVHNGSLDHAVWYIKWVLMPLFYPIAISVALILAFIILNGLYLVIDKWVRWNWKLTEDKDKYRGV